MNIWNSGDYLASCQRVFREFPPVVESVGYGTSIEYSIELPITKALWVNTVANLFITTNEIQLIAFMSTSARSPNLSLPSDTTLSLVPCYWGRPAPARLFTYLFTCLHTCLARYCIWTAVYTLQSRVKVTHQVIFEKKMCRVHVVNVFLFRFLFSLVSVDSMCLCYLCIFDRQ